MNSVKNSAAPCISTDKHQERRCTLSYSALLHPSSAHVLEVGRPSFSTTTGGVTTSGRRLCPAMKNHPKIKQPPRTLFSCGIFGHCTETVLSPTAPPPATTITTVRPPSPAAPAVAVHPRTESPPPSSSSSSSSSATSQSFTQWRFPLPKTPLLLHRPTDYEPLPSPPPPPVPPSMPDTAPPLSPPGPAPDLAEKIEALRLLERSLVPNPPPATGGGVPCPPAVVQGVVRMVGVAEQARAAVKVLLALCLAEPSRRPAVEAGAVAAVLEALAGLSGAAAERALAALELLCTVAEGVAELRGHALAVPLLLELVGKMTGRGAEYALSVLAAVCAAGPVSETTVAPEGLAQVVALALQGQQCSARARRKGLQLLRSLQEKWGLELAEG
ncbi:U-box domain-containing protein 26 [Nymphaea thermarum]|nr:U-box domain-containing protein 26 [Nymphaea thermarum]